MSDGGTIRVSQNFRKLFDKIKEQELKRTNRKPSDTATSEILYLRIIKAGGLKEV